MKNLNRNIKVIAVNNNNNDGFNIYLDFSGQREFLVYHRHNGILYNILKDGVVVDDFKRMDTGKIKTASLHKGPNKRRHSENTKGVVNHLIKVIDEYIEERELICA